MPASGGDPIAGVLRMGFSACLKMNGSVDNGLEVSAKRILQTEIKMEPSMNYKATVLSSLKSKYTVINTKVSFNKSEKCNGTSSPGKKQTAVLPVAKITLFPSDKIELGFRNNVPVGSGMCNLGNTCYLNSSLQALFHVPAFVNWLLADPAHQKCEQFAEYPMHSDDITCAVIKTLKYSQAKTGSIMKPNCIFYKLKAICKHFTQGAQEDAHEFMRYLLECLEKGFLTKVQGHNLDSWSKETTPINQIFGGYIRSEVSCLNCHAVSTTFQHFQDLPLDIRKAFTLNDALAGYFAKETLASGEDAYKCEKCCRKVEATKKCSIERPPNVLFIQLKRFNAMNTSGKQTKQVDLPRLLDLSPYLSATAHSNHPNHAVLYRLVSVVTHIGPSANGGHYTAIALAANNSYYHFDDTNVRQISVNTVQNTNAYLVLYELERPFQPTSQRIAPSTETAAQKESESASTGGSEAKEPRRSPTAGTLAPRISNTSTSLTSLVPYDSDAESDAEHDQTDSQTGVSASCWQDKANTSWKVQTVSKPTSSASTSPWRVTDLKSRSNGASISNGGSGASKAPSATVTMNSAQVDKTSDFSSSVAKPQSIVNELVQNNSHLGYGNNVVRSWSGAPNNLSRQIDDERRDRKRPYDDGYDADFDRGKAKRRYFNANGPREANRGYSFNPFQRRANDNAWHREHNGNYRSKWSNNWKDRKIHNKNHYRPYQRY